MNLEKWLTLSELPGKKDTAFWADLPNDHEAHESDDKHTYKTKQFLLFREKRANKNLVQ